jgi:hypothetical protein
MAFKTLVENFDEKKKKKKEKRKDKELHLTV